LALVTGHCREVNPKGDAPRTRWLARKYVCAPAARVPGPLRGFERGCRAVIADKSCDGRLQLSVQERLAIKIAVELPAIMGEAAKPARRHLRVQWLPARPAEKLRPRTNTVQPGPQLLPTGSGIDRLDRQ
jgi:hypothetical protein